MFFILFCVDTGEPRLPLFNVYPIEELVHKITRKIQCSIEMGNPEVLKEEQEMKLFTKNPSCIYSKFFNDQYVQAPSTACKVSYYISCILITFAPTMLSVWQYF
jgi:hypothetical protein